MPKPKELRIYQSGRTTWMDFCGELTDELYHSPNQSWVGAIFRKTRGAVLILTQHKKLVLRFGIGELAACTVTDTGLAAVAEMGSGGHGRVSFFFPDGTRAQAGKIKDLVQTDRIEIDATGSEATLLSGQHVIARISIPPLDRKPVPKAIVFKSSGCLGLLLFLLGIPSVILLLLRPI